MHDLFLKELKERVRLSRLKERVRLSRLLEFCHPVPLTDKEYQIWYRTLSNVMGVYDTLGRENPMFCEDETSET